MLKLIRRFYLLSSPIIPTYRDISAIDFHSTSIETKIKLEKENAYP